MVWVNHQMSFYSLLDGHTVPLDFPSFKPGTNFSLVAVDFLNITVKHEL